MIDSFKDAGNLWGELGDFWSLLNDRKSITLLWQGLVELVQETADHENVVAAYSIQDIPATETRRWGEIDLDTSPIIIPYSNIQSIPNLRDGINKYSNEYAEGIDYSISSDIITWIGINPGGQLFAPTTIIENPYLEKFFNNGYLNLDLTGYTAIEKKNILLGLWRVISVGPTINNINVLFNIITQVPYSPVSASVTVNGNDFTLNPRIQTKFIVSENSVLPYESKTTESNIIVTNNTFSYVKDTLVGSWVLIDGEVYAVSDYYDSTVVICPSLPDISASEELTALIYHKWDVSVDVWNNHLVEDSKGDRYLIKNSRLEKSLTDGEHVLTIVTDGWNDIYTLEGTSTFPNAFSSATIVAPFTPLQNIFSITTWEEAEMDAPVVNFSDGLKANPHISQYNGEVTDIYTIIEDDLCIDEDDSLSLIEAGSAISIDSFERETVAIKELSVTSTYLSELVVENDYAYRFGEELLVTQNVTYSGNDYVQTARVIIIDGSRDKHSGDYTLLLRTSENGLSGYDNTSTISFIKRRTYLADVLSQEIDSATYTLASSIGVGEVDLPIIRKAMRGRYGQTMQYDLLGITDDTITIIGKTITEKYKYVILSSHGYPPTKYMITSGDVSNGTFTLDRTIEYTYHLDNGVALFIRNLEGHNGYVIRNATDATGWTSILEIYPECLNNINKILEIALPDGATIEWRLSD